MPEKKLKPQHILIPVGIAGALAVGIYAITRKPAVATVEPLSEWDLFQPAPVPGEWIPMSGTTVEEKATILVAEQPTIEQYQALGLSPEVASLQHVKDIAYSIHSATIDKVRQEANWDGLPQHDPAYTSIEVTKAIADKWIAEYTLLNAENAEQDYYNPKLDVAIEFFKYVSENPDLYVGQNIVNTMLEIVKTGGFEPEQLDVLPVTLPEVIVAPLETVPEAEPITNEVAVVPETGQVVVSPEFTATYEQLDELEPAATSDQYEAALDIAYEGAASQAAEQEAATGEATYVSWSASDGYSTVSASEVYEYWGVW